MAYTTTSATFFRRVATSAAGLALFALVASGCVQKEDYLAIQMDRDNLAEQLAGAESEAARQRGLAESYRQQLARVASGQNAEGAMLANFQQQIADLTNERDSLLNKYEGMLGRIGTGPALPEALTSELTRFAIANPDLVEFDPQLGVVKFKSDVTFQSGDAELTPEARQVIGRFAQILNQPVARQYELRVTGHTDNVPVSNPVTRQRGHHDNWYLSSHRAISVGRALMSQGVQRNRIGVTGFADQRPVASNDSPQGRQQNRRVEVLILPNTVTGPAVAEGEPAADRRPVANVPTGEDPGLSK